MPEQAVYLDYCATTPVHPEVRRAMAPALEQVFGNPGSMHRAGRQALELVQTARAQVAAALGCRGQEVVFTSGATEADNLALLGIMHRHAPAQAHLVTTAVEHHAVLHSAQALQREGYPVTFLPVDGCGRVDPEQVRAALRPETRLVSVMLVNNEVGTIQPVEEIARLAHAAGVPVHTDAVQGLGSPGLDMTALGVDLLSLSAHKIYGPKGVGALVVREGLSLQPLMYGGTQEGALRPGTENVPGIVGLGAAMQLLADRRLEWHAHMAGLRTFFIEQLQQRIPGVLINGEPATTAAHVISASFPGADAEMMLIHLNAAGFAVSLGSACTSRSIEPSHVLLAMGLPTRQVEGTLRISLGHPTTRAELSSLLDVLPSVVERARIDD